MDDGTSDAGNNAAFDFDRGDFIDQLHWRLLAGVLKNLK